MARLEVTILKFEQVFWNLSGLCVYTHPTMFHHYHEEAARESTGLCTFLHSRSPVFLGVRRRFSRYRLLCFGRQFL